MKMKKIFCVLLAICLTAAALAGCSSNDTADETRATIYRTPEEWQKRWQVAEYQPNEEITGKYDEKLAAKCTNGIFVGQLLENDTVKAWRGIPFAKIPARFERSAAPDKSDKVYEALYFGKSGIQNGDESEPAGLYEQGEFDTLTLTVYTGNNNNTDKPVFVYVHGGAFACGGTTDPAYDATNLAYYCPDCVFVNITYRLGALGLINLGAKDENGNYLLSDYEANEDTFKSSNNLAILDVIQSLRWIKENIASFGGDPDNVTIGGESAGSGMVSNILMMASDPNNHYIEKEEGLFSKVFSMSGGINLYNSKEDASKITEALISYFEEKNISTVKQLQELTTAEIKDFWKENDVYSVFSVLDGEVLPLDPYEVYNKYVADDYVVLQGSTTSEYDYFRTVFKDAYKALGITHEDCAKAVYKYLTEPTIARPDLVVTDEFTDSLNAYMDELKKEGFATEEERFNTLLNDHYLQMMNYYMAAKQASNGGISYCYAFDEPYDPPYDICKAGHAVDVYYLFGTFTGAKVLGTDEQVNLSRKYQKMLENFMKTGNPSTEDVQWEPFDLETGYITVLKKEAIECIKGYNSERIRQAIKMFDENLAMRYSMPWRYMIPMAYEMVNGNTAE